MWQALALLLVCPAVASAAPWTEPVLPNLRLVEADARVSGGLPPFVTLREFERRWEILQREIDKAEQAMAHRLDGMNEFREQLRVQGATFATITELRLHIERLDRLDARVKALEVASANLEGRITTVGAGLAVLFTLLQLVFRFVDGRKQRGEGP